MKMCFATFLLATMLAMGTTYATDEYGVYDAGPGCDYAIVCVAEVEIAPLGDGPDPETRPE